MKTERLIKLGGASALTGGVLEVIARLTPLTVDIIHREALYFAVDVFLLFGVFAIYLRANERLGAVGFFGFLIAAIGVGTIIGPDAVFAGVDQYLVGGSAFGIGMAVLGIAFLLSTRRRAASSCWIAAVVSGLAGSMPAVAEIAGLISGLAFGLGFILAGVEIVFGKPDKVVSA